MTAHPATRYQNHGNLPLLTLLSAEPGSVILDCGCGTGDNARLLRAAGCTVVGVTNDKAEARIAADHCDSVILADLQRGLPVPPTSTVNVVLTSHSLEHLADPRPLLQDVRRLLTNSGGVLAVALPNVLNYRNRLSLLRGHFEYSDVGVMDRGHLRFYTFESGMDLLHSEGFDIEVARGDGSFPLWVVRRWIPRAARILDELASNARPSLFAGQLLYLARPQSLCIGDASPAKLPVAPPRRGHAVLPSGPLFALSVPLPSFVTPP